MSTLPWPRYLRSNTRRCAFTLIELLVVIAIIAALTAVLFPVFVRAKDAGHRARAITQMRQIGFAVMLYAGDYDDYFLPASMRGQPLGQDPAVWPPLLAPFAKNTEIFIAPATDGKFATSWSDRHNMSIGYNDATGYDPASTAVAGAAPPGTEGFPTVVEYGSVEEPAKTGLFALTPNAESGKERGYVFNPYNGPDSPDGDYAKGLPLIADVNVCVGSPLPPSLLKPIYARYGSTGTGDGITPVVFADGHTRVYSARQLKRFGTVTWRFR